MELRGAGKAGRRLGATREMQCLDARIAMYTSRTNEARHLYTALLADAPSDLYALDAYTRLRGTMDDYETALKKVGAVNEGSDFLAESGFFGDAVVCLNTWIGNQTAAVEELARWETPWRSRHAFGMNVGSARTDLLARSLACVGRDDDALTELEALVKEGYDIDWWWWRAMAVDPAYDGIRSEPRFRAVSDQLKAADAAARDRFRARPDLNDADIESLGM